MLRRIMSLTLALSAMRGNAVAAQQRPPSRPVPAGDPVLVDRNGTYMRITQGNDLAMIGGYAAEEGSQTILRVVRSKDGGSSWQQVSEVIRGDTETHDLGNVMVLRLQNGRILYAYRNHDRFGKGKDLRYKLFRISVSSSDDDGNSWNHLSDVEVKLPAPDNIASGIWEPFLRLARDGTVQCYFSYENRNEDQDGFMRFSRDNGATWSEKIFVSGNDVVSRDGMNGVAPIDDNGNLIAVFESTEIGRFTVSYVLSHDDGYNWGERTRLYTPKQGDAGVPQVWNIDGTLVMSFMTSEEVKGTAGAEGAQMKMMTSNDGGGHWGDPILVSDAETHFPGLYDLAPTNFLTMYRKEEIGLVTQKYKLYQNGMERCGIANGNTTMQNNSQPCTISGAANHSPTFREFFTALSVGLISGLFIIT